MQRPYLSASFGAAAAAYREYTGSAVPLADKARLEQTLVEAKAALGEAAFQEAWQAGQHLSLDEAITAVLSLTSDHPTVAPII